MDIRKHLGTVSLTVALVFASGIPSLAKESRKLALNQDALLSGTTLPAGKYIVRWEAHSPRATVEFARGHQVVLSTECKLEDRGTKYSSDSVLYDTAADGTKSVSEIRFAGSSEVLVFNQ